MCRRYARAWEACEYVCGTWFEDRDGCGRSRDGRERVGTNEARGVSSGFGLELVIWCVGLRLEVEPLGGWARLSADEVNVGVVGEAEYEWEDTEKCFMFDCRLYARGDGGGEYSC